ncbi:hypothetical protein CCP2SC5_430004 [Azospirillaceae bacterium]
MLPGSNVLKHPANSPEKKNTNGEPCVDVGQVGQAQNTGNLTIGGRRGGSSILQSDLNLFNKKAVVTALRLCLSVYRVSNTFVESQQTAFLCAAATLG